MNIQLPPTTELLAACDCVDNLIEHYLSAIGKGRVQLGRFEAEIEAYTLQKLIIRYSEAVLLMARHDMVLLPSAHVAARACFETHVKVLWLLKPTNPFEREARWIAHLNSASEHWGKLEKNDFIEEWMRPTLTNQKKIFLDFSDAIAAKLIAEGYHVDDKIPTLWGMLKDIGAPELYPYYIILSAYTHSNFEAASLYRKNLGCGKKLGEFISVNDWAFPIDVVWKSLFLCARSVLLLVEAPDSSFDQEFLINDFKSKSEKLKKLPR